MTLFEDGHRFLVRVRQVLLSPDHAWPEIEREPATVPGIIRGYLLWLALVPAVAGFVSRSVIGYRSMGFGGRVGIGAGLLQLVASVLLTLVAVYVVSRIVAWLAPRFGGTADRVAAFKLMAYSATAGLAGGIFDLVPLLGILGVLAGLYSLYLVYTGLPVLMKIPRERTLPCALAVIACAIVASLAIGAAAAWLLPDRAVPGNTGIGASTPPAQVDTDAAKIEALGRRIEEMGRRIEQAGRSGDLSEVARASREALGEVARGVGGRAPLEPARLKTMLPATLAGMKRSRFEAESRSILGLSLSSARASYADGARTLKLEIIDTGSAAGLVSALAAWAHVLVDRETDTEIEKTWRSGERVTSVRADKNGRWADYKMLLPNGIILDTHAEGMTLAALEEVVGSLDLHEIESAR